MLLFLIGCIDYESFKSNSEKENSLVCGFGTHEEDSVCIVNTDTAIKDTDISDSGIDTHENTKEQDDTAEETGTTTDSGSDTSVPIDTGEKISTLDSVCPLQNPYWDSAEFAANGSGYCVILNDNTLECYSSNYSITAPAGDFLTIDTDASWGFCGIKTNYRASCTALNTSYDGTDYGQYDAPYEDFCDITMSTDFACGILTDGTIDCWGRGDEEDSNGFHGYGGTVPGGNEWIKIQGASGDSVCAMDVDGYVYCWGSEFAVGELEATPSDPAVDFDVMYSEGVIILNNGSMQTWGDNVDYREIASSSSSGSKGKRVTITFSSPSRADTQICQIYEDGESNCNNPTTSSLLFNQEEAYYDAVTYFDPWISVMEDGSMTFETSSAYGNVLITKPTGSVKIIPFPE